MGHFTMRRRCHTLGVALASNSYGLWLNPKFTASVVINHHNKNKDYHPVARRFKRRALKPKAEHPFYYHTHRAAAEHVVFILESELAITYSDWRASIRHLKTLCNWCLSAGCLRICGAQINTIQLHVCISVIVMQSGDGKVAETLMFLYFNVRFILSGAAAPSSLLNRNPRYGSLYVHFMYCIICVLYCTLI